MHVEMFTALNQQAQLLTPPSDYLTTPVTFINSTELQELCKTKQLSTVTSMQHWWYENLHRKTEVFKEKPAPRVNQQPNRVFKWSLLSTSWIKAVHQSINKNQIIGPHHKQVQPNSLYHNLFSAFILPPSCYRCGFPTLFLHLGFHTKF